VILPETFPLLSDTSSVWRWFGGPSLSDHRPGVQTHTGRSVLFIQVAITKVTHNSVPRRHANGTCSASPHLFILSKEFFLTTFGIRPLVRRLRPLTHIDSLVVHLQPFGKRLVDIWESFKPRKRPRTKARRKTAPTLAPPSHPDSSKTFLVKIDYPSIVLKKISAGLRSSASPKVSSGRPTRAELSMFTRLAS